MKFVFGTLAVCANEGVVVTAVILSLVMFGQDDDVGVKLNIEEHAAIEHKCDGR